MNSLISLLLSIIVLSIIAVEAQADVNIVALNVFNEARNQPLKGQVAVAEVTLNRMEHSDYPNSARKVVFQRSQFSWTANKKAVRSAAQAKRHDPKAWETSLKAAKMAYFSKDKLPIAPKGSTHFYADYIKTPKWAMNKKKRKIGNHYFLYKES